MKYFGYENVITFYLSVHLQATFRIIVTFLVVSEGFSDLINQVKGGGGYILRTIKGDIKRRYWSQK